MASVIHICAYVSSIDFGPFFFIVSDDEDLAFTLGCKYEFSSFIRLTTEGLYKRISFSKFLWRDHRRVKFKRLYKIKKI